MQAPYASWIRAACASTNPLAPGATRSACSATHGAACGVNATNGAAPANPSSNVGNGATARSLKAPGLASAAAPPEVELVVDDADLGGQPVDGRVDAV